MKGQIRELEQGLVQSDCVLQRKPVCGQGQDDHVRTQGSDRPCEGQPTDPLTLGFHPPQWEGVCFCCLTREPVAQTAYGLEGERVRALFPEGSGMG